MLSEYELVVQENDILKDFNKDLESKLAELKEWYEEEYNKRVDFEKKLTETSLKLEVIKDTPIYYKSVVLEGVIDDLNKKLEEANRQIGEWKKSNEFAIDHAAKSHQKLALATEALKRIGYSSDMGGKIAGECLEKSTGRYEEDNNPSCLRLNGVDIVQKLGIITEDLDLVTREFLNGAGDIYLRTLMNRIRIKHGLKAQ